MLRTLLPCLAVVLLGLALPLAPAPAPPVPQDLSSVQIETVPVRDGVSMLMGAGGNIGVFAGEDGVLLVDDQFAPLTGRILAAVGKLSDQPVRFLVNTHWHGDHTGGNANLGEAGVLIVAHDNVRTRLAEGMDDAAHGRQIPPAPAPALPVVTFEDRVTFHWNGDTVEAFHVPPAHTDGDVVLRWKDANVIHTGDCFFNGIYPFIDVASGGSIDGMVTAAGKILALADEDTLLIPGHGPLGHKADLVAFRDMLATVRDRVATAVAKGRTKDEVVAAHPTAEFDADWGHGFLAPDDWVELVYDDLGRDR